jgi:hypothetical protein
MHRQPRHVAEEETHSVFLRSLVVPLLAKVLSIAFPARDAGSVQPEAFRILPRRVSSEYVVAALAGVAVFVVGFLIVWALLT